MPGQLLAHEPADGRARVDRPGGVGPDGLEQAHGLARGGPGATLRIERGGARDGGPDLLVRRRAVHLRIVRDQRGVVAETRPRPPGRRAWSGGRW